MFLALSILITVLGFSDGQTSKGIVAFSAGLDANRDLKTGSKVVYNKVFLNNGGGYASNNGIFTAPSDGVYVFHVYAKSQYDSDFWLELYHNNDYVVSAYASQTNDVNSAGNTVILQLKKGHTVYVRVREISSLHGKTDQIFCTFSGFSIG